MIKTIRTMIITILMVTGFSAHVYGGTVNAATTVPAGDMNIRPVISPISYGITYDLNGGSVTTANPTSYTIESGDITLNNPVRDGYDFTGWTGSNGYSPSASVTIQSGKTGALYFTANWQIATYTITYDLDGGYEHYPSTPNPTTYNINSDSITLIAPDKNGCEFLGWTGSNGTTPEKSITIPSGSTGNLTYKANWKRELYTVKWTSALSSVGSFLGTAENITGSVSDKGKKRIRYTDENGQTAYASPYQAGNIKVAKYSYVYFEMVDGNRSNNGSGCITVKVGTSTYLQTNTNDNYAFFYTSFKPTANCTLTKTQDNGDSNTSDPRFLWDIKGTYD